MIAARSRRLAAIPAIGPIGACALAKDVSMPIRITLRASHHWGRTITALVTKAEDCSSKADGELRHGRIGGRPPRLEMTMGADRR
jgi:hypothetical protein